MQSSVDPRDIARAAVQAALADGRLRSEPCVVCWNTPVHAHHPRGYDEAHRLDVVWLCGRCHERIHGNSIHSVEPGLLRRQRLATGMGIRQLSERTGINRGRLSILERGVEPTAEEMAVIAAALKEG